MSDVNLTSGVVMDAAASLLNDTAKALFPYAKQLPYLNVALEELQNEYEQNDVPVADTYTTNPITVPANTTVVGFNTVPALPPDLIEIQYLWERTQGINPFVPVQRVNVLPRWDEGAQTPQLIWFTWESNAINFLPANGNNDIKIDYLRSLFIPFNKTDGTDIIAVINAKNFLSFRTAALCAEFIGENKTRADSLNTQATNSMDMALGTATKSRQGIMIRRRPFRSGFKRRVYM